MAIYCETCGEEVSAKDLDFNGVHNKCGTNNNYEISNHNKAAFGAGDDVNEADKKEDWPLKDFDKKTYNMDEPRNLPYS